MRFTDIFQITIHHIYDKNCLAQNINFPSHNIYYVNYKLNIKKYDNKNDFRVKVELLTMFKPTYLYAPP